MPARSLIVGLDGLDLDLLHEMGEARLPTLFSLMRGGAYARLESVQPPATLPNWTTFLTALDPAAHGVFDFTRRHGYRVHFAAGTAREVPTLFARLDALGMRCACLGFPATWPPERLKHGAFMSGWDAPVAFEADRSFVHPPSLYDAITERFGTPRFDDVDEFDADAPGWHDALPGKLCERIANKTELGRFMLDRDDWDVFALYFGESDTANHHLYALHDDRSPRHLPGASREGLTRVYMALDHAVHELLERARGVDGNGEVELTIVSDHGSGGSSDKVLYLNRALADAGLLTFKPGSRVQGALTKATKDLALTLLPPKIREGLFRFGGAALPSWLESRARFGSIDMEQSLCFSEELNYFPAIWLNLAGREPQGIVHACDKKRVIRAIRTALLALRDPDTDERVVERVELRESLYDGPYLDRAPDLLLTLALDREADARGYSYNVAPSGGPGPIFERLDKDDYLGRKGRSLCGSHRSHGVYIAHGPRVLQVGEIEAHIADASATLLARLDVAVPREARGRVLFEILDGFGEARALPTVKRERTDATRNVGKVEARLRALGYIE